MHFVSSKVIAGCFGLSAFAVAIIAGVAAENSIAQVLVRALIATALCYPIGIIVGMICARVITEQVERMTLDESAKSATTAGSNAALSAASNDAIEDEQPIIV
jgi:hypothetical protein